MFNKEIPSNIIQMFPMNMISENLATFPFRPKPEPNESLSVEIDLECHDSLEDADVYSAIWTPKDQDTLPSIIQAEGLYQPNPNYISQMQPFVSANMRAVLYDWIFEVSSELCMKRDTTYYAMSYVDRLLSKVENIKKENYQLVGLTALYIAAKIEEIYPCKIGDFARAADNGYSVKTIRHTEKFMLKSLNWRMAGPTVYSITNWLMTQWDSFLHFHFGHISFNNPDYYLINPDPENQHLFELRYISFKLANHVSYRRFRETLQVLDASILDFNILKYSYRHIAAALMFLAISEYFRQTQYSLLLFSSPYQEHDSFEVPEMQNLIEEMFTNFISATLDIKSLDIICPAASALFSFFKIELNNDLPPVCKIQPKQRLEAHYEEFLSYQTHNPSALGFVKNLLKLNVTR